MQNYKESRKRAYIYVNSAFLTDSSAFKFEYEGYKSVNAIENHNHKSEEGAAKRCPFFATKSHPDRTLTYISNGIQKAKNQCIS